MYEIRISITSILGMPFEQQVLGTHEKPVAKCHRNRSGPTSKKLSDGIQGTGNKCTNKQADWHHMTIDKALYPHPEMQWKEEQYDRPYDIHKENIQDRKTPCPEQRNTQSCVTKRG